MKLNQMFLEFNAAYDMNPLEFAPTSLYKTHSLIRDEVDELAEEIYLDPSDFTEELIPLPLFNKENTVKELTDVLYITMQRMTSHGVDVEACLHEVHRSNMSKLVDKSMLSVELEVAKVRYPNVVSFETKEGVYVLKDELTGKVVKPTSYTEANMKGLV